MYQIKIGGAGQTGSLALSPQQIVSCCNSDTGCSSSGCRGGYSDDVSYSSGVGRLQVTITYYDALIKYLLVNPPQAINYVSRYNLTTSDRYPYSSGASQTTGTCDPLVISSASTGQAVQLSGSASRVFPSNSEAALMAAVAAAPTTVYFAVTNVFQAYSGGVMLDITCTGAVNHAMVAVGYSWTGSPESSYWILRNSWGAGWGEGGYIRVAMTGDGTGPCGMYQWSYQPPSTFVEVLTGAPVPPLTPPSSSPPPSTPGNPPPLLPPSPPPPTIRPPPSPLRPPPSPVTPLPPPSPLSPPPTTPLPSPIRLRSPAPSPKPGSPSPPTPHPPTLLQGGYNLRSTACSVEACLRVLLGEAPPPLQRLLSASTSGPGP